MFYHITQDRICTCDETTFYEQNDTICVLNEDRWKQNEKMRDIFQIRLENSSLHFCKIENHLGYLYATLHVPAKEDGETSKKFAFYILPEKIIFIDNGSSVIEQITTIASRTLRSNYTLERFLYDFLVSFLEEDLLFLQSIEKEIAKFEELILRKNCPDFNAYMLKYKKRISQFYRYYSQLTDIAQELMVNELKFFDQNALRLFGNYKDRAARLADETQLLRDYMMQVQDVYRSEISIRQNNIMKMLTIVTTIFLPLSLIAGWYGMNFVYMPELASPYAYPIVILVSILIVILTLLIFKKKKYW